VVGTLQQVEQQHHHHLRHVECVLLYVKYSAEGSLERWRAAWDNWTGKVGHKIVLNKGVADNDVQSVALPPLSLLLEKMLP
jgi:hypothetical protein